MTYKAVLGYAFAALIASVIDAEAHSWYPRECCGSFDCVPADSITHEPGGKFVIVGHTRIPIPKDFVPRSSPDGRIHVCFSTSAGELYGEPTYVVLCLYLPGES